MHNKPDWLLAFRRNITSQYGEDGILEKIFEIIGEGSSWCVELGALNGIHHSNTWHLIKERRWSGVLIEADPTYFEQLKKEYAGVPGVVCINEFVSFGGTHSLGHIFARTPLPKVFDFLSLDIDGNEYHLWNSLVEYRPRVIVVEFNPSIPHDVSFIQPQDMNIFQGSSLRSFVELGKRKGYELVAANETNAFFVLKELFSKIDMDNSSLDAVHPDRSYITHFFQLYDGTLRIAGNRRLIWHGMSIDEERLQVLPRRRRQYPARISSSGSVRRLKDFLRRMPFYAFIRYIRRKLR